MDGLKRLANSSKALAALAGIVVMLTLVATGQTDADTAVQAIAGLLGVLILAIAGEDAAEKLGNES